MQNLSSPISPKPKDNGKEVKENNVKKIEIGKVKTATARKIGENRYCNYVATIGGAKYSQSEGNILIEPFRPYIRSSRTRFSEARFLIRDPDSVEYQKIAITAEVKIEIGIGSNDLVQKFTGKIKEIGRLEPIGTIILAIDNIATLGSSTIPSIDSNLTLNPKTEDAPNEQYKTISSFTSRVSKSTKKNDEKLANGELASPGKRIFSHSKLAIGTTVRIVNSSNQKKITLQVNDKNQDNKILLSSEIITEIGAIPDQTVLTFEVLEKIKSVPGAEVRKGSTSDGKTIAQKSAEKITETTTQKVGEKSEVKYDKRTGYTPDKSGSSSLQQSDSAKQSLDATMRGDSITVTSEGTVKESSPLPSLGESTGLVLRYRSQRDLFLSEPILMKRSPLQINSGSGAITVQGWNTTTKELVSATVSNPLSGSTGILGELKVYATPTGRIDIKMPVFPGCIYTWGDATKQGERIPPVDRKDIYEGIIRIAQVIHQFTNEIGKGKWTITSWYRDPESNRRCKGKPWSRHLFGDGIDAVFPGMFAFHDKLLPSWNGGLATRRKGDGGDFFHIDTYQKPPKRRWDY